MKEQKEDEGIKFLVCFSTPFSSFPPSIIIYDYILKKDLPHGRVAPVVGVSSCTPKGCWFNSQLGHMPRVIGSSPQLTSVQCFSHLSLSLSLSLFSSPLLSSLKINEHIHR